MQLVNINQQLRSSGLGLTWRIVHNQDTVVCHEPGTQHIARKKYIVPSCFYDFGGGNTLPTLIVSHITTKLCQEFLRYETSKISLVSSFLFFSSNYIKH